MKYDSILEIQKILKSLGLYSGSLDGIYGKGSNEALRKLVDSGTYEVCFNYQVFRKLFRQPFIKQDFVNSVENLFKVFNEYNDKGGTNPLYIGYMLGTAWHESAFTLLPIKERGGRAYLAKYDTGRLAKILGNTPEADGDGIFYAGKGYVMITGAENYRRFSKLLNIDLINFPDLALDSEVSAKILTIGSLNGIFTGKRLGDYIKLGTLKEFTEARRVINGTDKASAIATHAAKFVECVSIRQV